MRIAAQWYAFMTKKHFSVFTRPVCLVFMLGFMLILSACASLPIGINVGGSATPTATTGTSNGASQPTQPALPTVTVTTIPTPPVTVTTHNTLLNINLITNGNAEAGPGAANGGIIEPIPGWTRQGPIDVIRYSPANSGGYISPTDPGPADRGKNYFWGGSDNSQNLGSSAVTSMTQTIDLTTAAALFAQGNVHFTLSAWLGGYLGQDDSGKLTVEFVSLTGQTLSTASVGPVLAKDRGNTYGLVQRSTDGAVPAGTIKVNVKLTITRFGGSDNDGSADDLSLVLHS